MHDSASTFMAPILSQFHFFGSIWANLHSICCKFSIIISKNYAGNAPSKCALWDEFSEKHKLQSIFLPFNFYVKDCTLIKTKLSLEIKSSGINYQSQIFRNEHRTVLLNAMNKACILSFRMQNLLNLLELIDVFNLYAKFSQYEYNINIFSKIKYEEIKYLLGNL